MSQRNKHVNSILPFFYQRSIFDVMAYTFIDTYRYVYASVTIEEAAKAFIKHHKVDENLFPLSSILMTYHRTNKDYHDAKKEQQ